MFHLLRMSPDAGLTLAIVKRIRALVWVGIGLALLPLARSGKKLTPEFSAEFESAEFQSPGFQGEVLKQ
jgi:hypothetical protein